MLPLALLIHQQLPVSWCPGVHAPAHSARDPDCHQQWNALPLPGQPVPPSEVWLCLLHQDILYLTRRGGDPRSHGRKSTYHSDTYLPPWSRSLETSRMEEERRGGEERTPPTEVHCVLSLTIR